LAGQSSCHSLSSCFWWQPAGYQHCDWESILVASWHILQHVICKVSAKLDQDRFHQMLSWASHNIAHVADLSHDMLSLC
jgi:hypothetical protein